MLNFLYKVRYALKNKGAAKKSKNTHRVSNLIGKVLSCRESGCRIEAGLTRTYIYLNMYSILLSVYYEAICEGKIANGKAMYLLNIV